MGKRSKQSTKRLYSRKRRFYGNKHTISNETIIESLSDQQQNASAAPHSSSTNQENPAPSCSVSALNVSRKKVEDIDFTETISETVEGYRLVDVSILAEVFS